VAASSSAISFPRFGPLRRFAVSSQIDDADRTGGTDSEGRREMSDSGAPGGGLTHFDDSGRARMVDVGEKPATHRVAVATGRLRALPDTIELIRSGRASKGDVLGVAQVAAIMAAKRTSDIIPMCHPLMLTRVEVAFELGEDVIDIRASVETRGQTGVEMEALTAVSAAALTIYDMVKAVDRGMTIEAIALEAKSGGRSGDWRRDRPAECAGG